MKFHNQTHYKNKMISGVIDKPLMRKKGKRWVVLSLSALALFGLGDLTHAQATHADSIPRAALQNSHSDAIPNSAEPQQQSASSATAHTSANATNTQPADIEHQAKNIKTGLMRSAMHTATKINKLNASPASSNANPQTQSVNHKAAPSLNLGDANEGYARLHYSIYGTNNDKDVTMYGPRNMYPTSLEGIPQGYKPVSLPDVRFDDRTYNIPLEFSDLPSDASSASSNPVASASASAAPVYTDIYSNIDGKQSPSTSSNISKFNSANSDNNQWAYVDDHDNISPTPVFNNQGQILVAPEYYGLTYKYDKANHSLEFTNGNLSWDGPEDSAYTDLFLSNDSMGDTGYTDSPYGVDTSSLKSVTFDNGVKVAFNPYTNTTNAMVTGLPSLQYLNFGNLDTSKTQCMYGMFSDDPNLKEVVFGKNFDTTHALNAPSFQDPLHGMASGSTANLKTIVIQSPKTIFSESCGFPKKWYLKDANDSYTSATPVDLMDGKPHVGTWESTPNIKPSYVDIYHNIDGLKTPNIHSNIEMSGSWSYVNSQGQISNTPVTNSLNQTLIAPDYDGMVYKYDKATQTLEFTNGSLDWDGHGDVSHSDFFLSGATGFNTSFEASPSDIDPNAIKHIKFDDGISTLGIRTPNFYGEAPSNFGSMFYSLNNLQSVNFGNSFNTSNVTDMDDMFYADSDLQQVIFGKEFDTSNVTNMNGFFSGSFPKIIVVSSPKTKFLKDNDPMSTYHTYGGLGHSYYKAESPTQISATPNDFSKGNVGMFIIPAQSHVRFNGDPAGNITERAMPNVSMHIAAPSGYHYINGSNGTFNSNTPQVSFNVAPNSITLIFSNGDRKAVNTTASTQDTYKIPANDVPAHYHLAQGDTISLNSIAANGTVDIKLAPDNTDQHIQYIWNGKIISSDNMQGVYGAKATTGLKPKAGWHIADKSAIIINGDTTAINVVPDWASVRIHYLGDGADSWTTLAGNDYRTGINSRIVLNNSYHPGMPSGYHLIADQIPIDYNGCTYNISVTKNHPQSSASAKAKPAKSSTASISSTSVSHGNKSASASNMTHSSLASSAGNSNNEQSSATSDSNSTSWQIPISPAIHSGSANASSASSMISSNSDNQPSQPDSGENAQSSDADSFAPVRSDIVAHTAKHSHESVSGQTDHTSQKETAKHNDTRAKQIKLHGMSEHQNMTIDPISTVKPKTKLKGSTRTLKVHAHKQHRSKLPQTGETRHDDALAAFTMAASALIASLGQAYVKKRKKV